MPFGSPQYCTMSNYWEVFDVVNDLIKSLANANKKHCTFYVDKFAAIPQCHLVLPSIVPCPTAREVFDVANNLNKSLANANKKRQKCLRRDYLQ
jgi:hypothetical protein